MVSERIKLARRDYQSSRPRQPEVRPRRAEASAPAAAVNGHARVLELQRQIGNRAVVELLAAGQAKLDVGAADDPFEREADLVARQVVGTLQRAGASSVYDEDEEEKEEGDEEEEEAPGLRRQVAMSRKPAVSRRAEVGLHRGFTVQRKRSGLTGVAANGKKHLKAAIGGKTAKAMRERLAKRFPKGPLFTAQDIISIQALETSRGGTKWLNEVGIGTWTDASAYLVASNYKDWLTLSPGKRLLVATEAWTKKTGANDPNPPPSFTLGRAMAIETDPTQRAQYEQQRDKTIRNAFVNTLMPLGKQSRIAAESALPPGGDIDDVKKRNVQAQHILTRILLILHAGLQVYDKTQAKHVDYNQGDVVRALAHGGRVNIRIPALSGTNAQDDPKALLEWIGITDNQGDVVDAVEERGFGTHHMNIGPNTPGVPGSGSFKEEGGKKASLANKGPRSGVKLFGMDIAAGGLGRKDFNGDVILPDGGHGHMFIGFTKPTTTKDGALQIGIETTGPGAPSLVGYKHTWQSTEATANPESSFYGHKMQKIGSGPLAENQRIVNLNTVQSKNNGDHWKTVLDTLEQSWSTYLAAQNTRALKRAAYRRLAGPHQNQF